MRRLIQGARQRADVEQRNVILAALNSSDVAAVKFRRVSQRLLRKTRRLAQFSQAQAEPDFGVLLVFHAGSLAELTTLCPRDITTIRQRKRVEAQRGKDKDDAENLS